MMGEGPTAPEQGQTDTTPAVHIQLLGGFRIAIGQRELGIEVFERRSAAELVQLLAVSPHQRLPRDQVIEALFPPHLDAEGWPDPSGDHLALAANRLHKAASYARKGLGVPDAVTIRNGLVALFPGRSISTDVARVESVDLADHDSVETALDLFRGELLPDAPYAGWLQEDRDRLRRRRLDLLRQTERWTELLGLEPADEQAHLALMGNALATGNRPEALRRYAAMERELATLGLQPGPEALALRERAAEPPTGRPAAAPTRPRPPDTALIGREVEKQAVRRSIDTARLVSVVGPGGVGKTHLAQQVVGELDHHPSAPIWTCSLARAETATDALNELLGALGTACPTDRPGHDTIIRAIGRTPATLLLDNCEHQLEAVRRLCRALLDRCPGLRILTTSQAPLRIRTETVVRLGPLSPQAAIELFVAEASRHGSELDTGHDAGAMARICKRLDHLPLAIILAAARARSLPLSKIEHLVEQRLDLLRDDRLETPERHRTLRAAIGWSLDGLDPATSALLDDLSVLAGPFTLDAALAVANRPGRDEADLLDRLDRLVTRSLLLDRRPGPSTDASGPDGTDGRHYQLLETVRLAVRQPTDPAARAAAQHRHRAFFRKRVERSAQLIGQSPAAAFDRFDADWDEIRLAAAIARAAGDVAETSHLADRVGLYALVTRRTELADWTHAPTDDAPTDQAPTDDPTTDKAPGPAALVGGFWSAVAGDIDRARNLVEGGGTGPADETLVALARAEIGLAGGDFDAARRALLPLGQASAPFERALATTHLAVVDFAAGRDLSHHSTTLAVTAFDDDGVHHALTALVHGLHHTATDPAQARRPLTTAIELADRHRLTLVSARARATRAIASARADLGPLAVADTIEAIDWAGRRSIWSAVLAALPTAALLVAEADRPDLAVSLLAARTALSHRAVRDHRSACETLARLHPDHFDTWWQIGGALDLGRAAELATRTLTEVDDRR